MLGLDNLYLASHASMTRPVRAGVAGRDDKADHAVRRAGVLELEPNLQPDVAAYALSRWASRLVKADRYRYT